MKLAAIVILCPYANSNYYFAGARKCIATASMFAEYSRLLLSYSLMAIPSINQFGSVAGNIMCFAVPLAINYYFIKNNTRFKLPVLRYSIKPLMSAVAMGTTSLIVYKPFDIFISENASRIAYVLPTIISMLVAVFIYAYVMIYLGGITKNDINSISPKAMKIIPGFMKRRMK